ncbi:hypothetical protein M378DRAFT_9250 [Amanita muscaria Koide BX008]|uniref:MARVEL domain-containing protein n=1 Tax=Amanita muscaria (strain Koide BX008) TaxID=946122 RepID=A0A0C2X032_AMAMK|nr:hypothetical protein M378DRAFT_9250 [Amanita muscaria Koide BX008]
MPLLDHITDALAKIGPKGSSKPSMSVPGTVPFEDDDLIVSRPTIIFHSFQIFFNFLAMACFASVASFQAKWGVGPSGLSGFALFVAVAGMFLSTAMFMIPVIYEKYDKMMRAAQALKEVRLAFIFTGIGVTFSLLIAFVTTISAWTEPGCKNAADDPHAKQNGDDFINALPGWCTTKQAGAVFFWLVFGTYPSPVFSYKKIPSSAVFWMASLGLLIYYWRTGKLNAPRDPVFVPPSTMHDDDEMYDEESTHASVPTNRQPSTTSTQNDDAINSPFADPRPYGSAVPHNAGRPSLDAYGAFSDPAPSGFVNPSGIRYNSSNYPSSRPNTAGPPVLPPPDLGPRVSRTMQYADPYAAVRASIATQGSPPSYESYSGYS